MEIDGDCRARSHVNVQLMSDLMRRPNDITRSSKGSTLGSERTKDLLIAPIAGNECQVGREKGSSTSSFTCCPHLMLVSLSFSLSLPPRGEPVCLPAIWASGRLEWRTDLACRRRWSRYCKANNGGGGGGGRVGMRVAAAAAWPPWGKTIPI